jgi:hypothetical protein
MQEVEAVGLSGPHIVGWTTESENYSRYIDPPEPLGYFVIDTGSNTVQLGLSREAAQATLPAGRSPALWSPYLWSLVP